MTIAIDVGSYVTAAERLRDINLDLAAAYDRFVTELAGCGGIAGSDAPAADFAAAYDDAAGAGVWAYMDVVAASGTLSQLVEISARNHATADLGSMLLPGGFMYEPDVPLPEGLPAKVWQSTPPSLEGGDGGGPDWWHWVADQVGQLYPDADCDELKELGRRWTDEASILENHALDCRLVADAVALQCSWEVDDAVASCLELGDQLDTLATTFRQLGEMCTAYADQVEDVREEIADIAKELLWWTIGTQIVTHGAAFFTVGFAEAPGQAYQVARVAIAAKKIRDVLAGLAMWSVTKLGPLNMVGREAASVSVVAQRLARPLVLFVSVARPHLPKSSALARVKMSIDDPKRFDPWLLRGLQAGTVANILKRWGPPTTTSTGKGWKYIDPQRHGRVVRLMPGYPRGSRPGSINAGPYAVVSQNGKKFKIPLEGNPTL